jgi:hypothetical protein
MKPHSKKSAMRKNKKSQYPETVGSRLAAKARKMANSLADNQRASHLHKALAVIYGSSGKKTVGVRR